jgi:hypothetical protein
MLPEPHARFRGYRGQDDGHDRQQAEQGNHVRYALKSCASPRRDSRPHSGRAAM